MFKSRSALNTWNLYKYIVNFKNALNARFIFSFSINQVTFCKNQKPHSTSQFTRKKLEFREIKGQEDPEWLHFLME